MIKKLELHYNYHRYYDPETGRYLRADPIRLGGGINFYSYASNNPIIKIDPWGTCDYKGKCQYLSGGELGGVATLSCKVETRCVGNKSEHGKIRVTFGGATIGMWPAGITWFSFCLNDKSNSTPLVRDLTGFSAIWTAGVALGPGFSIAKIKLGKVTGDISGFQWGLDMPNVDGLVGNSKIEELRSECCTH